MKELSRWLVALVMLTVVGSVPANPIKDGTLDSYKAGWYPNLHKSKLLTCPETCKAWVGGVAEHEKSLAPKSELTFVCKIGERKELEKPVRDYPTLFGNQFDKHPVCYAADNVGGVKKTEHYHCLCLADNACTDPDLVVTKINKPQWDAANNRSIITAEIKNIGTSAAAASIARIVDPSTNQSTGAPYNAIANTPALAAGASVTVTFYLPYWVYNPDADLEVTADYKGMVKECDENNNTLKFHDLG
jgi:hypothetical protein